MNGKRSFYEGVAVLTVLYGTDTWSRAVPEKRLNVMEIS